MPAQRCDLLRLGPSVATRQTGDVVQQASGAGTARARQVNEDDTTGSLLTSTNTCPSPSPPSYESAVRAPACSTSRPSVTLELCACVRLGKWVAVSQSAKMLVPVDLIGRAQVLVLAGDATPGSPVRIYSTHLVSYYADASVLPFCRRVLNSVRTESVDSPWYLGWQ